MALRRRASHLHVLRASPRIFRSPLPRENQIKHGPILAGAFVIVAGVDTVGRTYGASLFGSMATYINRCMGIITRYPGGRLLYSKVPAGFGGIIEQYMYVSHAFKLTTRYIM